MRVLHLLLRRFSFAMLVASLLAWPAGATWSIVVVNRRTGEVCVACASCLPRTDLALLVPAIVVGKGAGVAQAVGDGGAINRTIIFEGLLGDLSPAEILRQIRQGPSPSGQFGIVTFLDPPVTFTGSAAGGAKKGVAGESGDLVYAIQGNVLAGTEVIDQCAAALLAAEGDLGQRVLAAMERARVFGGDGRCSCPGAQPDDCGSPPEDFKKTAHAAFILLARMGDPVGTCSAAEGCANGDYHLVLGFSGGPASPDPVLKLEERYAAWRRARAGRPDGILSQVSSVDSLPADGVAKRTVTIRLADLDGRPLARGGTKVSVATEDGAPSLASVGPLVDRGDGSYSFTLKAGKASGTDRLVIRAEDDLVRATLYPFLDVRSDPPAALHAGYDAISTAEGAAVPFVVHEPSRPRGRFWLLGRIADPSLRGDRPLQPDPALLPFLPPGSPFFPGPPGVLDGTGRAEVVFDAAAGLLAPLVGLRLEWTALIAGKGPPLATNRVGFDLRP